MYIVLFTYIVLLYCTNVHHHSISNSMNGKLTKRLVKLGFLPNSRYLPHNGSVILINLEKNWVQDRNRCQSLLISSPPKLDDLAFERIGKYYSNKSVSFVSYTPVHSNYLSKLCGPCTKQRSVNNCCNEGDFFDISKLGFTEDKFLHSASFYGPHVAHAGYLEFDQMREAYYKYSLFFKFLHNFNPSNFIIEKVSNNTIHLLYQTGKNFRIPLQETMYHKLESSETLVLQSVAFLSNWYLAIVLDKFQDEIPPHYSAFHPRLAPCHVGVIPSDQNNQDIVSTADKICKNLNNHGVLSRKFESTSESGEIGVPFDIMVDDQSVMEEKVTLLDRKNESFHEVPNISKLPQIFKLYWNSVID